MHIFGIGCQVLKGRNKENNRLTVRIRYSHRYLSKFAVTKHVTNISSSQTWEDYDIVELLFSEGFSRKESKSFLLFLGVYFRLNKSFT